MSATRYGGWRANESAANRYDGSVSELSSGIIIRRAEAGDVDQLGELGAALMRVHYAFDPRRFLTPGDDAESGYAQFLGSQLDDAKSFVLLAERQGRIVGYVYAGIEPLSWKELRDECGYIHDLLVTDDARRSGVGDALLSGAIEWLTERGMPRVVLWTAAQNEAARRLFERRRFRTTMIEMTLEL
jgi:ribosomal protein S18 acetylase RimI-like enzyme